MIRLLIDTNVVLDALLKRHPWVVEAEELWSCHQRRVIEISITATSVTDIFYIARRHKGRAAAWIGVNTCLDQLKVIPVGHEELAAAALLPGPDFEDNLQLACAMALGLDAIVSRDPKGFPGSPVPIWSPSEALRQLALDPPGSAASDEAGARPEDVG